MFNILPNAYLKTSNEKKREKNIQKVTQDYDTSGMQKSVRPRTAAQRKQNMLANVQRPLPPPSLESQDVDAEEMAKMMQEEQAKKVHKMFKSDKRKFALGLKGGKKHMCKGKTKQGKRCKNKCSNKYCYRHKK